MQFTVNQYICSQPDDGPLGPLGTDDMLIDASDGQGRGLDLDRDASSVYNRLGGLDSLASILSCRNIDIADLHAILGRVAPFNHPVPASIELDNDSARVLLPPAFSRENISRFTQSELLLYQLCTRHHLTTAATKDLILTLKDPSFDQSEVDLDLEARVSL